jgi:hypothetical protein
MVQFQFHFFHMFSLIKNPQNHQYFAIHKWTVPFPCHLVLTLLQNLYSIRRQKFDIFIFIAHALVSLTKTWK